MTHLSQRRVFNRRSRRSGVSLVLFVAVLPIVFFSCAMVVDMGNLYNKRAMAQRAADAAALAGAIKANGTNTAEVIAAGKEYARLNNYNEATPNTTVIITPELNGSGNGISRVKATISRVEPVYFAPVFETLLKLIGQYSYAVQFSRNVGATATAIHFVQLPLKMPGLYGIADPTKTPANLSLFGPYGLYSHGDPYSTLYLDNGQPNPRYNPNGAKFTMNISANAANVANNKIYLQLYDPDTLSANGQNGYDEIRPGSPNNPTNSPTGAIATTTRYEVYAPDGRLVSTVDYGADANADLKWNNFPPGGIDTSVYGTGDYTIKVRTIDGSSENGFLMRAGPEAGLNLTDVEWNKAYGDNNGTNAGNVLVPIIADQHLQMNFTGKGDARFDLGYVGAEMAGKEIIVTKFDLDVGPETITYRTDAPGLENWSYNGQLLPLNERNGNWSDDRITLPDNFTGGNIYTNYAAGAGDTSAWELQAVGAGAGYVKLVE